MKSTALPLPGAAVVDTDPYADERGLFARFFCRQDLGQLLGSRNIEQVNFSRTARRGTVRGLHYQRPPKAEMKFVRCLRGAIYDVLVDVRRDSPTYLQWYGTPLAPDALTMLCIPEGFAHGFQALQDDCEIIYFVTHAYAPSYEEGLRYDDPALGIGWPLQVTEISDKDASYPLLLDREGARLRSPTGVPPRNRISA
jgi:dTDP-4-dehydrorhamnose 3,5-epimerase